jgi:hypothetical protein
MAITSEVEVIDSYPIKEGLSAFHRLFESTCAQLRIAAASVNAVETVCTTASASGQL